MEPGNIFVCWQPYKLAAVLGSCVAVCLWDSISNVAGMSVFAYPKHKDNKDLTSFGSYSMPRLMEMMFNLGARNTYLQAHIIGGAFSKKYLTTDIGKKNIDIAQKILKKNKIEIVNNDTGGIFGRKVLFDTKTGEIIVYKARKIREKDWYDYKSIGN